MDIDLGPALTILVIALYIIPGFVGLIVGTGIGILLSRKRKISKGKKLTLIFTTGILFAILFPLASINFSVWHTSFENLKFAAKEKQYTEQNLKNFRIVKTSFIKNNLKIIFSVPRKGKYRVIVYVFEENKPKPVFHRWVDGVDLEDGVNTLNVDTSANDFSIRLPADFAISIEYGDDTYALRNTRKSVTFSNAGAVEKMEGVIYYSDHILADKESCPVINYMNWRPCVPNSLFRIER